MLSNLFYLFQSVIIQDKSILLMTYNDNLTINDIKFRESSIPSEFNGVFALEVNRGSYAFSATNFTLRTFDNYEVLPVENTLADIKVTNGETTVTSYNYTYKKPHKLHIAYQIVTEHCSPQCITPFDYPKMTLYVNNLGYLIPQQNGGFSIYKNVSLPEGQHQVKIIAQSTQEWCSIPTKGDGFEAGRYLYMWTELETDHPDLYVRCGLYIIMIIVMIKTDDEMDEMMDK